MQCSSTKLPALEKFSFKSVEVKHIKLCVMYGIFFVNMYNDNINCEMMYTTIEKIFVPISIIFKELFFVFTLLTGN